MTDIDETIKRIRKSIKNHIGAREDFKLEPMQSHTDVLAICDAAESATMAIDALQKHIDLDACIRRKGVRYHLFDAYGNTLASGDTMRDMLKNLIGVP